MTFDPHRIQINSITGLNGFTVLASAIDNTAGKVAFLTGASLSFSSGALMLVQGFDGSLMPLDLRATLSAALNPESNPARLRLTAILCQQAGKFDGLTNVDCTTVLASGLKEIDASLAGRGTVSLSTLEFVIVSTAGALNLSADIHALPRWVAVLGVGLNF